MNNFISDKKINYYHLFLLALGCLTIYLSEREHLFFTNSFFIVIYFINRNLRKFIIYLIISVLSVLVIPNLKVSNEFNPAKKECS